MTLPGRTLGLSWEWQTLTQVGASLPGSDFSKD
jgi:hypothetical protein